jgi:hypothetical protein
MSRSKQAQQIAKDDLIGIFRITGESRKRNPRGPLAWACECVAAGHPTTIEHAVLAYGATPTICTACAQQAATQRVAAKLEERKLAKELAKEIALQTLELMRQSAPVVEQQQVQEEVNAA